MKKKILALLLVGIFVLGTLSGCGSGGSGGSVKETSADEKVEIKFSWWGSDDRHQAMQEVARLFEEENPNVTVSVEYGAFDSWQTKLLTQLSGKTEADVMQVNYNWFHSFGKGQNVFYDLNELGDYIDLGNWDAEYLKSLEVGGEQAGVPHGMTGRVNLINTNLLAESKTEFPKTYAEMSTAAAAVAKDNTPTGADNKYVFLNVGEQCKDLYIAQMLYNETGKVMQADGKVLYSQDEVKKVLEAYKAMEDEGATPTFAQDDPIQNESNPVWTGGRTAAVYEWAGTLDKYTNAYKGGGHDDELAIAEYITTDGTKPNVYVKPNMGYAVSKNSKHPDVAAKFIDFMFTNEEAVKALGTSLGISSNEKTLAIQEKEGLLQGKTKEAYDMLAKYEQTVIDPYFEDENVRGQRYDVLEAFRSGKYGADEAAQKYIDNQQKELDKLYEK